MLLLNCSLFKKKDNYNGNDITSNAFFPNLRWNEKQK